MKNKLILLNFIIVILFLILLGSFYYIYLSRQKGNQEIIQTKEYKRIERSSNKTKELKVKLLFSAEDMPYLKAEEHTIKTGDSIDEQCFDTILELIKGPKSNDLLPTIPEGTHLKALFISENGEAFVDFSNELISNSINGSEEELLTIYSIVNTLILNFPMIKKVQILVDNKERETLNGHIYIGIPLKYNAKLMVP